MWRVSNGSHTRVMLNDAVGWVGNSSTIIIVDSGKGRICNSNTIVAEDEGICSIGNGSIGIVVYHIVVQVWCLCGT